MLNLYIKHYPVTARMPNFDFMTGFQKDARRVKRSCESINSTEAEEHNSFDHSKIRRLHVITEQNARNHPELYPAWAPSAETNIVTSRLF